MTPNDPSQPAPSFVYLPPPPPAAAPSTMPVWLALTLAIGVGAVGVCLGYSVAGPSKSEPVAAKTIYVTVTPHTGPAGPAAPTTTAAAPPTTTKPAPPPGPQTSFGDGTWLVGSDIAAGTYRTIVPEDSVGLPYPCYWARLKLLDGSLNSILANDNVAAKVQAVVTIRSTDKGFESNGCGTWTKIG